ncbi:MAG: hypothetical protein ABMA64_34425 [Myxococcota bacterium]
MIRHRSLARLSFVLGVLLACTACLEHVEALTTRVVYDPFSQTFTVRRTLVNVEAEFLACADVDECLEAIGRTMELQPASTLTSFAQSDRLLQRLIDSGARELALTLHRDRDQLDVVVDYVAPVGSPAAADTLMQAEWKGRGKRGHYYLVMEAQERIAPPRFHGSRKFARSSTAGGTDWVEQWVLPRWTRRVETTLPVDDAEPLFERFPELAVALEARGWLDTPATMPTAEPEGPRIAALLRRESGGEVVVPPSGAPEPAPDLRGSPAKAWFYDARISGGGVTVATAAVAIEPLKEPLGRCYAERQRDVSDLQGNLFLSALVRPDGSVIGTSVNSSIADSPLMTCVERVITDLRFAPWGQNGDGVSDVVIPVVLRVEKGSARPL